MRINFRGCGRGIRGAAAAGWLAAAGAAGADWPQFLGPDRNGVSREAGLARSWPADGPKVLWTRALGRGYGGAAVYDAEVFVMDRRDGDTETVFCLDLETGAEKWRFAYPATGMIGYPGSRTVPAVDERFVYAMGGFGDLHCLERATGKRVWSRHLVRDFRQSGLRDWDRAQTPRWGVSQSPLLHQDMVIVAPQTHSVGVVAYDRLTGAPRWQSPPVGRNWFSHVSPHLAVLDGVEQVVMLANEHAGKDPAAIISGVDANRGALLWQIKTWKRYNVPIPQPVNVGADRLFIAGGYQIGCFMLRLRRPDGVWTVEHLFKDNTACTPHLQTPIFYRDHIYANSFDRFHNRVNNGLVCLDTDGNLKWRTGPDTLFDSGNLIIADGLIYIMHGATGALHLYAADPAAPRLLDRAEVLRANGGEVWAPMALSRGRLIVRDLEELKCLDVKSGPVR
jgi:outer membrane protein assembly factor BamB